MVRWSLMLTAVPVAMFVIAVFGKPQPAPAIAVEAPVMVNREARQDQLVTFGRRWPLASEVREVVRDNQKGVITAARASDVADDAVPVTVGPDKPSPSRHRSKQTEPRDVCSRHNMHKVTIRGGRSWRCRR